MSIYLSLVGILIVSILLGLALTCCWAKLISILVPRYLKNERNNRANSCQKHCPDVIYVKCFDYAYKLFNPSPVFRISRIIKTNVWKHETKESRNYGIDDCNRKSREESD